MGRFSQAAGAEARKSRRYFVPGKYKVRIVEVETFDVDDLLNVAVRCEILASSTDAVEVGEIRQASWPLQKKKHPGPAHFKAFIAASTGADPDDEEISEDDWANTMELVCSSKQPLTGKLMDVDAYAVKKDGEIMLAKNGDPFCNFDWRLSKDDQDKAKTKPSTKAKAG